MNFSWLYETFRKRFRRNTHHNSVRQKQPVILGQYPWYNLFLFPVHQTFGKLVQGLHFFFKIPFYGFPEFV